MLKAIHVESIKLCALQKQSLSCLQDVLLRVLHLSHT